MSYEPRTKQIYEPQRITRDGIAYLVPLQDINKVDSLRKGIGLEPLSEYMKDCGLKNGWSKEFYTNNINCMNQSLILGFNRLSREKILLVQSVV